LKPLGYSARKPAKRMHQNTHFDVLLAIAFS
jgi:hypothetical protein